MWIRPLSWPASPCESLESRLVAVNEIIDKSCARFIRFLEEFLSINISNENELDVLQTSRHHFFPKLVDACCAELIINSNLNYYLNTFFYIRDYYWEWSESIAQSYFLIEFYRFRSRSFKFTILFPPIFLEVSRRGDRHEIDFNFYKGEPMLDGRFTEIRQEDVSHRSAGMQSQYLTRLNCNFVIVGIIHGVLLCMRVQPPKGGYLVSHGVHITKHA